MNNKDIDAQFLCKDCTRYNLCEYYHRRRKDSYICKYFHLSVTPQEPQTFKWCETCKEYDQEKHCCHRWSKVIRDTVEEIKQEPFINKPCVSSEVCEHDKQNVLDKIRAEIAEYGSIWVQYQITGRRDKDIEQLVIDVLKQAKEQVLEVIDKYRGEQER